MLPRILQRIGVDPVLAGRVLEAELLWQRPLLWWIGLALLVPAGIFIFRRHRRSLPHLTPVQRGVLTGCRVGILGLLVFVLGGPYLRLEESVTHKPVLAFLADVSESMSLPVGAYDAARAKAVAEKAGLTEPGADGTQPELEAAQRRELENMPRGELLERVWERAYADIIEPLETDFDIRGYRFDGGTRPAPPAEVAKYDAESLGSDTAIGSALREVIEDAAGRPLAGIVLFSDGRSNAGPDPMDFLRERLGAAGAAGGEPALWSVAAGSAERLPDVRVTDVLAPARVTGGDTAEVIATLVSHGFGGREIKVRLLDGADVLDERSVALSDDMRDRVHLRFRARGEPGPRLLRVEAEPLAEEKVHANNTHHLTIEVDDAKWSLLYIEGYPRWDFRFLDHALRRDRGLEARVVMEAALLPDAEDAAGPPPDAGLPEDAEAWAKFDVVLLGDVSPALLTPRLQRQLVLAVRDHGLGLVVQAGPENMPHAFWNAPLAELLPVELAPDGGRGGWEAEAFSPYRMKVTAMGSAHPAIRLYDQSSRNRDLWNRMPPFYWVAAAGEPGPGATVLAEFESAVRGGPMIAGHYAGSGRVVLIGSDETFRWRRNIGDHLFYRFWGQMLRHAARLPEDEREASRLTANPPTAEPGETVVLELAVMGAEDAPPERGGIVVSLRRDGHRETLELDRTQAPGIFRGEWVAGMPGDYVFSCAGEFEGGEEGGLTARVRVVAGGMELLHPDVDREALGALAETMGGELLELDELHRLAGAFDGAAVTRSRLREQGIWDNWLTLLLLASLYCADILVRRMAGVV